MQNQQETPKKLIDVDTLVRKQKNKFFRNLPQFLINLIKRTMKQDELNKLIYDNRDKDGVNFCNACMADLNYKFDVTNEENIRPQGRFIFVANHPLGAADVGAILNTLSKKYTNVKAVGNRVLGNVENIKSLLIEVGVFSRTDITAIKNMNKIYESKENQILTFPSGLVSRKTKGVVRDLPWKNSFIKNAVKYKRDVVPILVDEVNSNKFYFVANLRKFFKLKINIESLFIPENLFENKNGTVKLIVGKPISYKTFDKSKSPRDWALTIQDIVYNLKNKD